MKLFYRQAINFSVIFVFLFGGAAYFAFWGIGNVVESFSTRNALLTASQFRQYIQQGLQTPDEWNEDKAKQLRKYIYAAADEFREVQNFYIVLPPDSILFALNKLANGEFISVDDSLAGRTATSFSPELRMASIEPGTFQANWPITGSTKALAGVVKLSPRVAVNDVIHTFNLRFYLLGFVGILGIILLALIGTKTLQLPTKKIEKALVNINRRKFGYRLRFNKSSEFSDTYEKANVALSVVEQLDNTQRQAVQKQNALTRELKTIRRFMDMLAHEIKNPLHSFGLNLDVLRTKVNQGQAKQNLLKHVNILDRESEHLNDIVHGFLHYVRPGVPQRERSQVNDIIKEVCQMVTAEAEKLDIQIETRLGRGLPDIMVDRRQFQQALHNLVKNGIQASARGSKINVRSWSKRGKLYVSVKDNGAGMDAEQLQRIFDLYYTTKKEGTGLGLPITKRMVEANGGELELNSEVEKGTSVKLIFPVS